MIEDIETEEAIGSAKEQQEEKDGIGKALDIIETHEKEELEARRLKKEQDLLKL